MPHNLKATDQYTKSALKQVRVVSDVYDIRRCLAILLVNKLRCSIEEAAELIGVSARTICRLRKEFRNVAAGKSPAREDWGGRRNSFLSMEEETDFLSPFVEKARAGELVIIASIQESFEHTVGKEVPPSTITRLLDRHRWRKIEPEPRHPDEDKVAQEAFKKKGLPKSLGRPLTFWLPPDLCG
jgi:transposase